MCYTTHWYSMRPDADIVRVRHMIAAAAEALEYVAGRDAATLEADRPLLHCLTRCMEIIGEAASRITPATRNAHPEVPWNRMIGPPTLPPRTSQLRALLQSRPVDHPTFLESIHS